MVKSSLLRRCAEVIAALIIVVSTVVYVSVGIKNAGNGSAMLVTANMSNSIQDNAGSSTSEDSLDTFSQDNSLESTIINPQAQGRNEMSVVSRGNSIKDDPRNNIEDTQLNDETEQASIESDSLIEEELATQLQEQGHEQEQIQPETKPEAYKYVSIESLNVRKGPSSETDIIGKLKKGERVQVSSNGDEWTKIITSDNVEAYVFTEYLADTPPPVYKYISSGTLNIRKSSSSESEKLGTITSGSKVQVFEESGEYIRILTAGGIEGYVLKDRVVAQSALSSRSSSTQQYNSDLSSRIIEYAKTFEGVSYVYGGSSPKGFDCSGFTQYVLKHFGIKAPRSAHEYSSAGTSISRNDIKPGDIILFDRYNNYRLGHVGIYLGNDKFIHASSSKGKVVIASLSKYSGNILGIRRFAK